jgi:MFS family permease
MVFKKGELKLLWPFYLYYFIYGLSAMILPFMIIYFRDLGFSFLQISIITAAFAISMFVFEIPTGAMADGFSRKYSVMVGFLITAFAAILIGIFSNFYVIVLLWILAGLGMTFVSGAEEAWVIDNLNKSKRKDLHHEFFIKSQSIAALGVVFAPLIGAVLVQVHSIRILWFVFGAGFLLNAIILTLFAKEHFKPKKIKFTKAFKEVYRNSKEGLKFTIKNKIVFYLILGSIFASLMLVADNGWQPLLVDLSMPTFALGYMYSILAVFMIAFSFSSKLFTKFKIKNVVSINLFIRMVLLFSLLLLDNGMFIFGAIIFIIVNSSRSINNPLLMTYFHKFVPSKMRATVISVKSMSLQLIVAIFSLVAGGLLDVFGPQKILAISGLFGVFAILTYRRIEEWNYL